MMFLHVFLFFQNEQRRWFTSSDMREALASFDLLGREPIDLLDMMAAGNNL